MLGVHTMFESGSLAMRRRALPPAFTGNSIPKTEIDLGVDRDDDGPSAQISDAIDGVVPAVASPRLEDHQSVLRLIIFAREA